VKNDVKDNQLPPRDPRRDSGDGDDEHLPGRAVFAILVALAVACIGGYFLVMKLVDISKQEDCFLAGRHNCGPRIDVPSR
jgi:hypothetical protein